MGRSEEEQGEREGQQRHHHEDEHVLAADGQAGPRPVLIERGREGPESLELGELELGDEDELGHAEGGHEHLRFAHLTRGAVDDRHGVPGVIDEQLLTGAVILAHDHVQLALPGPVVLTEPAVLVTLRVLYPVLLPEQKQGHVLAP